MGVSTDAILAFGVELEDEELPYELEDEGEGLAELDEYLAKRAGLASPYDEPDHDREDPEFQKRRDAYWEAKKKLAEDAPVQIVYHQHHEFTNYIVAIKGTVTRASRGYPKTPEMTTPPAEMWAKARAFCEENEIQFPGDPRWLLASYWG